MGLYKGVIHLRLFLAVTPSEVREASRFTSTLAHVAYCIGPESTLLRQNLLLETRGGLLSISDRNAPLIKDPEKLAAAVIRECSRRNYMGTVLDFEASVSPDRQAFINLVVRQLSATHRSLLVPEAYAVSGASVLINTAVSGGNLLVYLQEARHKYGQITLDLQRLAMDFTLPERTGKGTPLKIDTLKTLIDSEAPSVYFSQDLCARYFTYSHNGETHFVLYDDADTLIQKLRIGNTLGVSSALVMYPEVSDLLPRLFSMARGESH